MNRIVTAVVLTTALWVCPKVYTQQVNHQKLDISADNDQMLDIPAETSLRQQQADGWKLPLIMEVFGEYQERLGASALALGDINSDGWPDFGVSSYSPGELRLYLGGPGILDSLPDLVLKGGLNAVLADINGDGIKDVVTVKQHIFWDTAFFYIGRKEFPLRYRTEPDFRFIPHVDWSDQFGKSLETGDYNGDGYADIALGDRWGGGGEGHGMANGVVYIFMGARVPDSIPTYILEKAEAYYSQFGYVLQSGDVNGDGYDDLAAGRMYENITTQPHNIYNQKILFLGGPNLNPLFEAPSQVVESNNIFGALVNGFLTDVNADGKDDLVFSYNNNGNVLYGTSSGLATSVGRIIPRPDAIGWGGMVRLDHDITGDGYVDYVLYLLSINISWASFHYGSALGVTHEFAFNGNYLWDDDFADPSRHKVCSVGDVNGDRRNDVLVSGTGTPGGRGVFQVLSGIGPPVSTTTEHVVPTTLALADVRPNPSPGPVTFHLSSPTLAQVRVSVFNALGQEVYLITEAVYNPGTHTLRWNGHDAAGTRVPPGVYLLRATSAGSTVTQRIVMQ